MFPRDYGFPAGTVPASDNIPGVKGIGEKTALTLVQNFGTLEGVYEHIDDKLIKPKQRERPVTAPAVARPRAGGRFAGVLWNNSTRM